MTTTVRVFQTHDAAGREAPAEFAEHFPFRNTHASEKDVWGFIAPLQPRSTSTSGVYAYVDPGTGSGWLRVEGYAVIVGRMDELVRLSEINAAIGRPEPFGSVHPGSGGPAVFASRNPFVQFVAGLLLLAAAVIGFVSFSKLASSPPALQVVIMVLLVVLALGSAALVFVGARRMRWWLAARAQAKRDGGSLPSDLETFG